MTWVQVFTLATPLILAMLGVGVGLLKQWESSAAAAKHGALKTLADLGIQIGDDAMALLRSTPNLTPAGALSWAISEIKALAPGEINTLGQMWASMGVEMLVRRSILGSAQGGQLDDAANAVITALSPSVGTVKVTPNQLAAVKQVVVGLAPEAVDALFQEFMNRMNPKSTDPTQTPAPTPSTPAPSAPALSAAAGWTPPEPRASGA